MTYILRKIRYAVGVMLVLTGIGLQKMIENRKKVLRFFQEVGIVCTLVFSWISCYKLMHVAPPIWVGVYGITQAIIAVWLSKRLPRIF